MPLLAHGAKTYDVVGVGLSYYDQVFLNVESDTIDRFNIPLGGGRLASPADLDLICKFLGPFEGSPGGSAANAVAVAAALGARTGYLGKAEHDIYGVEFQKDLQTREVTMLCDPYRAEGMGTARCLVLCLPPPTSERSFAFSNGVAELFEVDDFAGFDAGVATFVLFEGLLLQSQYARRTIRNYIVRESDRCRVVVTLHGTYDWHLRKEDAQAIWRCATIISGTELEQRDFQQALPHDVRLAHPRQIRLTTMGARGASLESLEQSCSVAAVPLPPSEILSTTGAGDAFLGAFLAASAQGLSDKHALDVAARAAAESLKTVSARPRSDLRTRIGFEIDNDEFKRASQSRTGDQDA